MLNSTAAVEHFRNEIFTTRCLDHSVSWFAFIYRGAAVCVGMFAASRAESYTSTHEPKQREEREREAPALRHADTSLT